MGGLVAKERVVGKLVLPEAVQILKLQSAEMYVFYGVLPETGQCPPALEWW